MSLQFQYLMFDNLMARPKGTARLALSALLVRHMYEQGILLMYCNRYTGVVGYVLDSKLYEQQYVDGRLVAVRHPCFSIAIFNSCTE